MDVKFAVVINCIETCPISSFFFFTVPTITAMENVFSRSQTSGYSLKESRLLAEEGSFTSYPSSLPKTKALEIEVSFTEKKTYRVHLNLKEFQRKCNWFTAAARPSCRSSSYFMECTEIQEWSLKGKKVCSFSCPTSDKILIKSTSPISNQIMLARLYADVLWIPTWKLPQVQECPPVHPHRFRCNNPQASQTQLFLTLWKHQPIVHWRLLSCVFLFANVCEHWTNVWKRCSGGAVLETH